MSRPFPIPVKRTGWVRPVRCLQQEPKQTKWQKLQKFLLSDGARVSAGHAPGGLALALVEGRWETPSFHGFLLGNILPFLLIVV